VKPCRVQVPAHRRGQLFYCLFIDHNLNEAARVSRDIAASIGLGRYKGLDSSSMGLREGIKMTHEEFIEEK